MSYKYIRPYHFLHKQHLKHVIVFLLQVHMTFYEL